MGGAEVTGDIKTIGGTVVRVELPVKIARGDAVELDGAAYRAVDVMSVEDRWTATVMPIKPGPSLVPKVTADPDPTPIDEEMSEESEDGKRRTRRGRAED